MAASDIINVAFLTTGAFKVVSETKRVEKQVTSLSDAFKSVKTAINDANSRLSSTKLSSGEREREYQNQVKAAQDAANKQKQIQAELQAARDRQYVTKHTVPIKEIAARDAQVALQQFEVEASKKKKILEEFKTQLTSQGLYTGYTDKQISDLNKQVEIHRQIRDAANLEHKIAISDRQTANEKAAAKYKELQTSEKQLKVEERKKVAALEELELAKANHSEAQKELLYLNTFQGKADTFLGKFGFSIKSLQYMLVTAVAVGLTMLTRTAYNAALEMETYRKKLTNVFEGATGGSQALTWARQYALSGKAELKEVVSAMVMMGRLGIQPTKRLLEDVNNVAIVAGRNMANIGQGISFAMKGNWWMMQRGLGIRKSDVMKYAPNAFNAKGQVINSDLVLQGIQRAMEQPQYTGAATRMASGMTGISRQIRAYIVDTLANVGDILKPAAVTTLRSILSLVKEAMPFIAAGLKVVAFTITAILNATIKVGSFLLGVAKFLGWFKQYEQLSKGIKSSFSGFSSDIPKIKSQMQDFNNTMDDVTTTLYGMPLEKVKQEFEEFDQSLGKLDVVSSIADKLGLNKLSRAVDLSKMKNMVAQVNDITRKINDFKRVDQTGAMPVETKEEADHINFKYNMYKKSYDLNKKMIADNETNIRQKQRELALVNKQLGGWNMNSNTSALNARKAKLQEDIENEKQLLDLNKSNMHSSHANYLSLENRLSVSSDTRKANEKEINDLVKERTTKMQQIAELATKGFDKAKAIREVIGGGDIAQAGLKQWQIWRKFGDKAYRFNRPDSAINIKVNLEGVNTLDGLMTSIIEQAIGQFMRQQSNTLLQGAM